MKQRYSFLFLMLGLFLFGPVQAQIKVYQTQEIAHDMQDTYSIPNYDSTSNISFHQDNRDYQQYIGQQLYFYERASVRTTADTRTNYDNFKLLLPDTVWYRKKKNPVKYRDYSDYDAYQHQLTSKGVNATPYQEIEGKTFTITAFDYKTDTLVFTLYSSENNMFFKWELKSPRYIQSIKYSFPAMIMGYYQKAKQQYIGRSFIASDLRSGYKVGAKDLQSGESIELRQKSPRVGIAGNPIAFKCVDVAIVDINNEYKIPHLIFEDSLKHQMAIRFLDNPSLSCMLFKLDLKSDAGPMGGWLTIADFEDVLVVQQRALQAEQQRIAKQKIIEEQRIEEEKIQQARQAQHLADCIKKFGKSLGTLIANGSVKIGMTKEQCQWSWGFPDDINRTTGSFGAHEQWVYESGNYLYFENGILTVIQN